MMTEEGFDAIVIGGGFAGVTAARELRRLGKRSVILEARDRLGGRTWTADLGSDVGAVEMGGTYVHWHQPHVWSEISRYGLTIAEDMRVAAHMAYMPADSGVSRLDPTSAHERMGDLWKRYFVDAAKVFPLPYEPLAGGEAVNEADQMSYRDRLNQMALKNSEREWLATFYDSDLAYTHVMRWWALSAHDYDNHFDILARYRLTAGTVALLRAILADAGTEVQLEARVESVASDDDGVEVTTSAGEVFRAAIAVVAVPLRLWTTIKFSPPLSSERLEADAVWRDGDSEEPDHYAKVYLELKGVREPFLIWPPHSMGFKFGWTYKQLGEGRQLAVFFGAEETDRVSDAVKSIYPGASVRCVAAHDWYGDELARSVVWNPRPGGLTGLKPSVSFPGPEARLVFGTSELARGWAGFIDGAIEAGTRAGRLAANAVDQQSRPDDAM